MYSLDQVLKMITNRALPKDMVITIESDNIYATQEVGKVTTLVCEFDGIHPEKLLELLLVAMRCNVVQDAVQLTHTKRSYHEVQD